jgi:endonuclease/exonuclease/phosphatase family metal-dependent hydrolase
MKLLSSLGWLLVALLTGNAAESTPTPPLRIFCYNIHHGEGLDGKVDLNRIAQLIKDSGAQVAALQEVDRNMARTQRVDIAKELARQLGWSAYFSPNLRTKEGGEYGNALLTALPVSGWKNTILPQGRPTEPRGLLQATVRFQEQEVEILTTHLDADRRDDERLRQAPAVLAALTQLPANRPFVLCGDFNDSPKGPAYALLAAAVKDSWGELYPNETGYTIPANKPTSRIDFFWTKPSLIKPTKVTVLNSLASDHLPLVGEFVLPPKPASR